MVTGMNYQKKTLPLLILLVGWLGVGRGTGAEPDAVLDWKRCVEIAVLQNPQLQAAEFGVIGADARVDQASGTRLPQVQASASTRWSGQDDQDTSESFGLGLSASQQLFDAGRTRNAVDQATVQRDRAFHGLRDTSAEIRYQLRVAFVRVIQAIDQQAIARQILGRREQSTQLVRLRYEVGREHLGSLLTAEAKEADATLALRSAGRNVEVTRRQLATLLGWEDLGTRTVTGNLDVVLSADVQPEFAAIAIRSPVLAQAEADQTDAGIALDSSRADRWPSVSLGADLGRSGSEWPSESDSWSTSLRLSLPLFEGGSAVAAVRRAEATRAAAAARVTQTYQSLVSQLERRWTAFQDAAERVAIRRQYRAASETRSTIAETQYSNGTLTFDNWVIIESEFVDAERALINAQTDAMVAEADWIRIVGGTLDDER